MPTIDEHRFHEYSKRITNALVEITREYVGEGNDLLPTVIVYYDPKTNRYGTSGNTIADDGILAWRQILRQILQDIDKELEGFDPNFPINAEN